MNSVDTTLQTPFLLFILCALSAMAFVVSAIKWFVYVLKSDARPSYSYAQAIWSGQGRAFVFGLLFSLAVAAYSAIVMREPVNVAIEVFILLGVSSYLLFRMGARYMIKASFSVVTMGVLVLCGWLVTIGLGYSVFIIIKNISAVNSSEFLILVVFLSGLSWNLPIFILHKRVLKNPEKRSALAGRRAHQFLWPILFSYVVLIFPLIAEQTFQSEEWQAMKYEKNVSTL